VRAVVQRIRNASVSVDNNVTGKIDAGLLVYLGVALGDTEKDADYLADKIINLRIFEDADGKMNRSVIDESECAGEVGKSVCGILAISQFTLLADARKGRRPSYSEAADPESANRLYEYFMSQVKLSGLVCEKGIFQAHMMVNYTNDGPVTILLDSRKVF
jgi:D-tyrosyl-tRNA(Tyr) deacylase